MGFTLHPAPFLGWAGTGVDSKVRFYRCASQAGRGPCRSGLVSRKGRAAAPRLQRCRRNCRDRVAVLSRHKAAPTEYAHARRRRGQWNMKSFSLANCASN
ncbi:hypothetical protein EFK07_27820 [Pseudomonas putida]|uniref:Uncharacterized protein n=1 Tax=Pseudomonas putida TaxID=303 RepID=A0A3M8SG55_PSEPU|nr:hypothetical protein EFK07_27820 [Pseudomonas putida]